MMSFNTSQWVWDNTLCLYHGSTNTEAWFLLQRCEEEASESRDHCSNSSTKSAHTGASDDTCADSYVDRPVYTQWTSEWTDDRHNAVLWFFDPEQWFYAHDAVETRSQIGCSFFPFQLRWYKIQRNGNWLWYLDEHTYFYTSTGTQLPPA